MEDVTAILEGASRGDPSSAEQLLPLVYAELRRLAARRLAHERPGQTLQPTALVHEAYLRLVDQRQVQWQNRAHFLAVAAQAMRRILVDHARARSAAKRGNAEVHMQIEDAHITVDGPSLDIVALDNALTRLAARDARQVQVVELRFFGGLSVEEAAEVLGVSAATVKREWSFAKAWLRRELSEKD